MSTRLVKIHVMINASRGNAEPRRTTKQPHIVGCLAQMHTYTRTMGRSWGSVADFESFLDAGGIVEPTDDMPDEYRQQVFRFIELHANSELMGGLTERDWIPKAPGLRRKMAVLAKTQDEIGHAHLLYMVAADLGMKMPRARCSRTSSPGADGSTTCSTTRPSPGPTRWPSPTSSTPAR